MLDSDSYHMTMMSWKQRGLDLAAGATVRRLNFRDPGMRAWMPEPEWRNQDRYERHEEAVIAPGDTKLSIGREGAQIILDFNLQYLRP